MAAIANAIDFFHEEILTALSRSKKSQKNHTSTNQSGLKCMLYATYAVMTYVVLFVHDIALIQWRTGWSSLCFAYFMGSTFQFLGLFSLALKVHANKSVAGISSQSLVLFIISLSFRIFTTLVFDGYLPVDKSGDFMVQMMDAASCLSALYILYAAQKLYAHTYQEENDTMPIGAILLSCVISACYIHGQLNHNFFDKLWAFSLNVEVFQLVPQLYMMAKVGGVVDAATAHFVGNVVLACLSRFVFWIWAIPGCKGLAGPGQGYSWNMELGAFYILGAYLLQTLIALDFTYYYVKAWWRGCSTVSLPKAEEI